MEMNNEKIAVDNPLYSIVSLDEFKSVLGIDDREDKLCRFCLVTSTLTIESYCMRKFLRKQYFERITFYGDLLLPLKEYPVNTIYAVYIFGNCGTKSVGEILDPDFYSVIPDCGVDEDIPFSIELSPALRRVRGLRSSMKLVMVQMRYRLIWRRLVWSWRRGIWGGIGASELG